MVYVSIFKVWNGDEPPPHCPCDCPGEMSSWSINEYGGVHIFNCDVCDVFVTWIPGYLSKPGPACPKCGKPMVLKFYDTGIPPNRFGCDCEDP